MVRRVLVALALAAGMTAVSAQENQVRRLPEVDSSVEYKDYMENNTGFWAAVEASGAYSCRLSHSNFGYGEVDAVVGYRFNDYARIGLGVGARYYFDNSKVRTTSIAWACPLFFNVRGNFIPSLYRSVVPYYSIDFGGTIRDGLMVRPTVGLRFGMQRSAFLLGLGYVGQDLKSYSCDSPGRCVEKRKFVNFVTLKLGYEF